MSRTALVALALPLFACAQSTNPRDSDGGRRDAGVWVDAAPRDGGVPGIDAGPRTCAEGCAILERCVDGLCVSYPPCAGDGSCPAGEICVRRTCLPAGEDLDSDGYVAADDCDEGDPMVHPGATEDCDGVDDDCDGSMDDGVGPRMCSTICGTGTESCVMGSWGACSAVEPVTESCDGVDNDCDGSVDEDLTRACSSACGAGIETCRTGIWGACSAPAPRTEECNNVDDDCDGSTDEALTRGCATACGTGNETCRVGAWSGCDAPPVVTETCNLVDDDCDGACDDAAGGCRLPVHRSYQAGSGEHFYTASRSEAACCGFTVESYDYFYLYGASNPGVQPFYRCLLASGFHFYTRSSTCEGAAGATLEGLMGYVGRTAGACGSVPLYRLVQGNDHFYARSAADRDAAVSVGYRLEGIEGYVWTSP